jgi:hypothetical protein
LLFGMGELLAPFDWIYQIELTFKLDVSRRYLVKNKLDVSRRYLVKNICSGRRPLSWGQ